jgi:hypothetical protein
MSSEPPAGWGAWESSCDDKKDARKKGVENPQSTEYGEVRIHLRVSPAQKKSGKLYVMG